MFQKERRFLKFAALVLIQFWSTQAASRSSIHEICQTSSGNPRDLQFVEEVKPFLCRISQARSSDTKKLAKDVADIVDRISRDSSRSAAWKNDPELRQGLLVFVARANQDVVPDARDSANPLREAILDLHELSLSGKKISAQQMYAAYRKVISQTQDGPRLIACLENHPDPRFGGFTVEFDEQDSAKCDVSETPGQKPKLLLLLNPKEPPVSMIAVVAHEMQHACSIQNFYPAKNNREEDVAVVVEEHRGHRAQISVFKDLARAAPSMMCSPALYTDRYGPAPMSLGEETALFDDELESGEFTERHLRHYESVVGNSGASSQYLVPGQGGVRLSDDLDRALRAAGFKTPNERIPPVR